MNKNVILGLMGLATAASIGVHLHRNDQPRYAPRKATAVGQVPQGQQEWLNLVRQNLETGIVDPMDHMRMSKAVARYAREQKKAADYQWVEMGPDNVGGRIRGICVDPTNNQKIWAGSVSGGLFRSMDGANTWQRIESFSANLMVSSIAVLGNGQLYVATGNEWENAFGTGGSGFYGMGLFRSDDDAGSFTQVLGPSDPWNETDWTEINRIVAHTTDPNRLLIASSNPGARIYNAADGTVTDMATATWADGFVTDVDISTDGQTILATLGANGDCWRSVDGGQTFEKLDGSPGVDFPDATIGRLEMAISPDDGNYMYALAATAFGRMEGVWYSTNRGDNWFRMWPHNRLNNPDAVPELDIFRDNSQGLYDNAIAVRPGHPDEVWLGGVELWKTSISGQPQQLANLGVFPGCFFCVHADVHEIVFADESTCYIGCDGGVHKTPNGGLNFYAANRDLAITQFYSVAYNAAGNVGGGTQDNGTQFIDGYGNTPNEASSIGGGDGFDIDFSQMDTNIFFTSVYLGAIYRSNDHGNNSGDFYDDNVPVDPDATLGVGLGDFYTNFRLFEDPNDGNSPYVVKKVFSIDEGDFILPGQTRAVPFVGVLASVTQYGQYTNPSATDTIFGPWNSGPDSLVFTDRLTSMFAIGFTNSEGVWGTREALNFNTTPQWAKLVDNVGGGTTCLEWSADGDVLFYGTDGGRVYRVTGFDQAYDLNTLSVDSPGYVLQWEQILSGSGPVTGLAPDPTYGNILVATYGGYGGTNNNKVRRTVNALDPSPEWSGIWNVPADLRAMPCYDACIHKDNGNVIVVGTEFGIWATDDAGDSWTMQNNGINGVPVFAMRQQTWNWQNNPVGPQWVKNPNVIYAGTHGRGIFRTESLVGIRPIGEGATNTVNDLLMVPNPANTMSTVSFTLAKQGDVTVNVYDLNGGLVRTITRKNLAAARQNVPINVQEFATGTYVVEVRSSEGRTSGRMVVAR